MFHSFYFQIGVIQAFRTYTHHKTWLVVSLNETMAARVNDKKRNWLGSHFHISILKAKHSTTKGQQASLSLLSSSLHNTNP